jgi:PAS domain S-box-containing protein
MVPLLVSGLIIGTMLDNQLRASLENRLKAGLETFSLILDYRKHDLIRGLERIASDNTLQMKLELDIASQMKHYLASLIAGRKLAGVCVADMNKKNIAIAGQPGFSCSLPNGMDRTVNLIASGEELFFGYSVPILKGERPLGYALGAVSLTDRAFQTSLQENLMSSFIMWVDGQPSISDIAPETMGKIPNVPQPGLVTDIQAGSKTYRMMVKAEDYDGKKLAYAMLLPLDQLKQKFQLMIMTVVSVNAIIFGIIMFLARRSIKELIRPVSSQKTSADTVSNGVWMDIAEHRRLETALRITQFSFDKAAIGIYQIGPSAQIINVNEQAARNLGYSIEELTAMSIFDIDPLVNRDNWVTIWRKLCKNGTDAFETIHRTKDGVEIPVRISSQLLEYDDQQFSISFVQDISDRKDAEKEAKRMGLALMQSQKMEAIGTLASGVAHDFNNILSAVIGYSELALPEVAPGAPVHGYLRQILTAGMRARDLVQQILTFSRKDERQLLPIKAASQVKEALKLLRSSLPETIEISQHIDPGIKPVLADSTQIHQIVMNLCTNAAHAMEAKGGRLNVSMSQILLSERDTALHPGLMPGKHLKLSVQDTGRGISPEIMQKIYDPYFTTKEKGKGTGLGLSVVQGIVQSYGGVIYAYSEPNHGTTFNVYIPSVNEQTMGEGLVTSELPGGNEHILLVDDEPALIDVGRQLLEKLGYRVSTAGASTAALEMFRRAPHTIDMVVTDMTMPKMTGDKLAAELLNIRPDLPILLATGYGSNIFAGKVRKMGIKALLHKPIVEADLARIVRKVLDESKKNS